MATIINADTSDGLKLTSDTSGVIEFQSAGVTKGGVNSTGLTGDGSQLTGIAGGGMTLLGTVNTTSGTSVATGTLDLSTYKTLQISLYNIGTATGTGLLRWAETGGTAVDIGNTVNAGKAHYGMLFHDLTTGITGIFRSYNQDEDGTAQATTGSGNTGANTAIDTATTSITFTWSAGTAFDKGVIKIYGLK